MTDLSTQRRLAASILKVGVSRVYIDPEHLDDAEEAITRDDVRSLIKTGLLRRDPPIRPVGGGSGLFMLKSRRVRGKVMAQGKAGGTSGGGLKSRGL